MKLLSLAASAIAVLSTGGCALPSLGIGPKAPEVVARHPLSDQILTPRPGFEGRLTNRACLSYDESGKCSKVDIAAYSLDDSAFRATVNSLGFICSIGGHRYKICRDKPGFCRISYEKKCKLKVFCKTERHEEYLAAEPYQYLLDAKAQCRNPAVYPFTWGAEKWGG